MSGIKPRLVQSLKESNTHWVEELDSVLWRLRTTPNRTTGYTPFFMVYGAEAVLPCDIIHDSPRVHIYEEREAELDRQDCLDSLEEERDVVKARSVFLSATGSKISKQRSTGQNLQRWRISSTPAGQERGQAEAQVGRSLHNRPSPDWWSVPSSKCIG